MTHTTIQPAAHMPFRKQHAPLPATLGYLGLPLDHRTNLANLLESRSIQLCSVPDSSTFQAHSILPQRLARFRDQLYGTRNPHYAATVADTIDRNDLTCLLAYWGTWILGDVAAIKRIRPRIKILLNVLCHPTGLSPLKVALQNRYFRRMAHHLDGIIYPSEAMKHYVETRVLSSIHPPGIVWQPFYSKRWFPTHRLEPCENTPNLLFLGRTDFLRAQSCDNVAPFLDPLLNQGIHLYHNATSHIPSAALLAPHGLRHTFPYQPLDQLETFATQFDASLVLYNLAACTRTDRFDNTIPDRLIASVTAGLPVALPRSGYAAAREYLRPYRAVISFDNTSDLAEQLRDRQRIQTLKDMAREDSRHYHGEAHLSPLLEFIAQHA